jgi:hypothetical protein
MSERFVIEGTWTGYTSSQQRICHVEVTTNKKRVERLRRLHKIVYTDGTALLIHIREAKPREKVKEILSYRSMIRDAEAKEGSVVRVEDLI